MTAAQPDPPEEPSGSPPSERLAERGSAAPQQPGVERFPGRRAAPADLHLKLLERLGPPSVLVDARRAVVHLSPQAGRYLQWRGGGPSHDLLELADPALRPVLAATLLQAARTQAEARSEPVELDGEDGRHGLSVRVVPAADLAPGSMLVLFERCALAADAGQAELERTNRELLELLEATGMATVFVDPQLRVRRYTPSATRLFSLIPADQGRRLTDLATPLDYAELAADARRVLERVEPFEREVGDRAGRCYLARLLPYPAAQAGAAGVALSFLDVTERKQAGEQLRWLSTVVHSSTDAIISFSVDFTILSWNAGAERLYGYPAQEVVGRTLFMLAPGREAEYHENMRRIRLGQAIQYEAVRRRKDGTDAPISVRVSPIHGPDGDVIGGTAIARDMSAALQASAALRASEERLRLMVENAREYAIFSMDLQRRVTRWNAGAERLLGYSEAEILGRPADLIFTPEDRAAGAPDAEAQGALLHERAGGDRTHLRRDGSRFWAEGVIMLMRDGAGQAVGFVKILRDCSQAREAQQAIERSQAELRQALQETEQARRALEASDANKDRFLAVLSHELRNPLASIASASELLLMARLPESARQKAAEVVQRQARAMKALLDELLDVSRLTLGRLSMTRHPVAVAVVIQSALEATRPLVQAASHELVVHLPPPSVQVDGDPMRLAQVVSNLVTNAAKYTPESGRIDVSAEVFHDEVVIEVSDNGIGIDPSQIDRMFDLFSQGQGSLDRSNGGLGIGLALARNIVELHGGWIMASSAGLGQGCQVRVGLPLLRDAAGAASIAGEPPPQQAPEPAAAAEGELILVADDNGDAAWGLAKLLELSGFRAVLARSGGEALQLAEQERPAVALLDIGMPDLSGHEVARRLRATDWGRAMILIAATGWGQDADVQQSMEAGFDAHLTKPLNVGRIRGLIEELSARRKS
ncbi:PAS domain S-box protein [Ramlibacter sp.]|uniref:PAS domain S-box protein n=1 Tax=Ramlibacter sp. TaxID=1917967 RepID=UPI002FC63C19